MSDLLGDYVDVAERIAEFYSKYPDGTLRMDPPEIKTVGDRIFLIGRAEALRTPDDTAPGVGWAWEPFPGSTNFTRGSELQNLETSAWGRAIAALGIATKRGIATKQDVRAARARDDDERQPAQRRESSRPVLRGPAGRARSRDDAATASPDAREFAQNLMRELSLEGDMALHFVEGAGIKVGARRFDQLTKGEISRLIDELKAEKARQADGITRHTSEDLAQEDNQWTA